MGRAKFTPVAGLDALIAARFAAPEVTSVAREVEKVAKDLAPGLKTWRSMRDGGVRRQHVLVDGEAVPENVRFRLTAYEWDVQHPGRVGPVIRRGDGSGYGGPDARMVKGAYTWLLEPRDTTAGAFVAIVNCRCRLERDPDGIAKLIDRTPTVVIGTKVSAKVVAEGKWVVESEYGDVYPPFDMVSPGAFYMTTAARTVAARRRARR